MQHNLHYGQQTGNYYNAQRWETLGGMCGGAVRAGVSIISGSVMDLQASYLALT